MKKTKTKVIKNWKNWSVKNNTCKSKTNNENQHLDGNDKEFKLFDEDDSASDDDDDDSGDNDEDDDDNSSDSEQKP